ncbi:DUF6323 family protein [Enterococcus malodoratus]|uniref:Uncharacterized protein n=1 Tax=Enterococcus malodoratus ATCC 43197 TaxID=1158601 RepID=R2NVN4_9ENTE|nr:DUF6323 family protein [Enterococcus malodoratus]EOH75068.1 hypothetical protein UAI_03309 [Enterococcus malodoratus ATCC 43197]EOT66970.1 hypothetical protein I585_02491 [Enterococcus malodoratus ATCC 43197]OJG63648.1 hypothetical protein RV07_GL000955 [Enterococcus malodoratus]SPX03908.1 Uncharacterised protein [Enterococcus malodoratus]STD69778.1 Uncharacterised protein [Enterococcus malodoratus]
MTQFDLSLFNQYLSERKEEPRTKINQELQVSNKSYQLSAADFSELAEERNQLFKEHHLLDFSWENSQALAGFLVTEPLFYKSDYLEHLSVCQAIFYYLRAYHPGQITDQEIIDEIQRRYQTYQGDLEMLQGSFEDFPDMEADE